MNPYEALIAKYARIWLDRPVTADGERFAVELWRNFLREAVEIRAKGLQ